MTRFLCEDLVNTRSAVMVDLRLAEERDLTGWIPGSVWVPHQGSPEDWGRGLPTGRPLVLVCMTGRRSLALSDAIREVVDCDVTDLAGGIMGWSAQGLPLVRADRGALSEAQSRDLRSLSADEFRRDVLSCFVATAIKVDATHNLDGDPMARVYDAFQEEADHLQKARRGVERLAARAFAEGYPLDIIAENCCFYHHLAGCIEAG